MTVHGVATGAVKEVRPLHASPVITANKDQHKRATVTTGDV